MSQISDFNSRRAEFEFFCLWRDVRSKPKDQESVDLGLPFFPSARLALSRAVAASTEFTDTRPGIRIPPVFSTDAAHHLLTLPKLNRLERQLLVLSISTDIARQVLTPSAWSDANATRQLIALSVPTEVAKQLLVFPVSPDHYQQASASSSVVGVDPPHPDSALPVSPSFTEVDAHQPLAISTFKGSASKSSVVSEENALRHLIKLSISSAATGIVPITSVFSATEVGTASKLLDLFASSGFSQSYATLAFTVDDFVTAHSLLDRFAYRKRQDPAALNFGPSDVASAHRLRALFSSDDPRRSIGPIFLAFPDAEESPRLVPLSSSEDAARYLLELSINGKPDLP